MSQQVGQCVYCGRTRPLTHDHIPPKALWGKPRPSDLLTVPSCTPCNVGASNDDEYFKTAMIIKDRAGSHPEAVTIRSSVFRGLALPKKEGFRRHILRNTGFVSLNTPAGLYLGHKPALTSTFVAWIAWWRA